MDLRKKIQEIQKNANLTCEEKSKEIFKLMNPNINIENKEEEKEFEYNLEGCKHYKRGCLMKAECCGKLVPCRLCHDEILNHKIDRYKTKYMKCKYCNKEQIVSNKCIECEREMAYYYCNICKFWNNDKEKDIYHCEECGLCRIGKKEDFIHCNICNICIKKTYYNNHKCVKNTMYSHCPICKEDLFTSIKAVSIMKCGHSIHLDCLNEYILSNNYQCPLCKKSTIDMSLHWKQIEEYLNKEEMPEEFKYTIAKIYCNDCDKYNISNYHFLYNKCNKCNGYNTTIIDTKDFIKIKNFIIKIQKKISNE